MLKNGVRYFLKMNILTRAIRSSSIRSTVQLQSISTWNSTNIFFRNNNLLIPAQFKPTVVSIVSKDIASKEFIMKYSTETTYYEKQIEKLEAKINARVAEIIVLNKQISVLQEQLELARDIMSEMIVLIDLRYDGELKLTKYWLLTPQSPFWQQDMSNLIKNHFNSTLTVGSSKDATNLLPPLKMKISIQYEDTFLKWLYIMMNSHDEFIRSLRTEVSTAKLIQTACDLAYLLTVAHHSTHQKIPKKRLGIKLLSTQEKSTILKDVYNFDEEVISNAFLILGMKE